jgi:hypothetical protein
MQSSSMTTKPKSSLLILNKVTRGVTGARRLMYAFANGGQKEMRSICPWSGIRDYASVADDFSSASGL